MLNKKIPLSEADVRKAKPKATEYTLSAGDGLFLLVKPSGHKFWVSYYYYNGNRKAQDFGSYPLASLTNIEKYPLLVDTHSLHQE